MKCRFSFKFIINTLTKYWSGVGCTIFTSAQNTVGAATLHPATFFASIDDKPHKLAYLQPVVRPCDGRYGLNPNRLYQHHQYQVLLKPSPYEIQELYLESLSQIGINDSDHDIRFVEDDWENPSIGASGLGWEIWCNGMEITQFTYMQKVGSLDCVTIPGELAYGLERIALHIQEIDNVYDIIWDDNGTTYRDMFLKNEEEFSKYALEKSDSASLFKQFDLYEFECQNMLNQSLPRVAYEFCIKSNHTINLLDAIGAIGPIERAKYISKVRDLARSCAELYIYNNYSGKKKDG